MSHLERLLRGVEQNESKILELTRQLNALEKTVQNVASQDFGGQKEGGIKQSSGEIRIGSAKKASKIDKDGFSIFAFALGESQGNVGRYDILTNLQKIPTDLEIAQFYMFGIQGDKDPAEQFPMNATSLIAQGMIPSQRPLNDVVVADAELSLRAAYGGRSQESGVEIFTLSESHWEAVPFIQGLANSNKIVLLKDAIRVNSNKERVTWAVFPSGTYSTTPALLRTEPDLKLVRYKDQGTLVPVLDTDSTTLSITNSAAWETLYEFSIPANVLGVASIVRAQMVCTEANTSGTTRNITFRVTWGGVSYTTVVKSIPNGTAERMAPIDLWISGDGATNAQKLILAYENTITVFALDETPAVDSTVDNKITVQVQWAVADALLVFKRVFAYAEWLDSVDSDEKNIQPWDDILVNDFATVEIE